MNIVEVRFYIQGQSSCIAFVLWTPASINLLVKHGDTVYLDGTFSMCEGGLILHTLATRHPRSKYCVYIFSVPYCMCRRPAVANSVCAH